MPELRLLVAGDGPLRGALVREAGRELGRTIRLVGFVEDVRAFMAACDICAFPTEAALGEGFGLAALEAMAVGRPVIATRVGSLPEVVTDEVGVLVRPGSARALADSIVRLARDEGLRRRLGERAAERAFRHFPLERMVRSTLEVYEAARWLSRSDLRCPAIPTGGQGPACSRPPGGPRPPAVSACCGSSPG